MQKLLKKNFVVKKERNNMDYNKFKMNPEDLHLGYKKARKVKSKESRIEQLEEEVKELREFKQMMENYLNNNREQL